MATPDSSGVIQLNWVHGNHLGVPLVTTDATGALATTPNDYLAPGFPGQSRVLADLFYNRYRDYDPVTGRYIQADPIGLEGGSNPYVYANANPMRYTDPSGLDPIGGAIGGVVGGWAGGAAGALVGPEGIPIGAMAGRWAGRTIGSAIGDACISATRGDDDDICYSRWEKEDKHCSRWSYLGIRAVQACRSRAAIRRDLCIRNGGRPNPAEPDEWDPLADWYGERSGPENLNRGSRKR